MKQLFSTLLSISLATGLIAQCNPYFDYNEGDYFEQTAYNKKGKEQSVQHISIKSVEQKGSEVIYLAEATSNQGKEEFSFDMEILCEDGVLRINSQQLLNSVMQQGQTENLQMDFEGDPAGYPAEMTVGDKLENNTFKMTMKAGAEGFSMDIITNIEVTDRKVESKESITTPAGTFDCLKITYKTTTSSEVMGMNNTQTSSGADYIAPRHGVIKSESFDEKGKLSSYSLLTKMSH
ncbi:MAG: hypothetical protein WEC59_04455 [Salibacteraceae bacterium]